MAGVLADVATFLTVVVTGDVVVVFVEAIGVCIKAVLPRDCPRSAYATNATITVADNASLLFSMPNYYDD